MSCFFCHNEGGTIIYSNQLYRIVMVNDEPDYPGYLRLIVNEHYKELTDLSLEDNLEIYKALIKCEKLIRKFLQPDKINLASLGNLIPHIHWHIIPRYQQDKHFPNPIWGEIRHNSYHPSNQLIENSKLLLLEIQKTFENN